MSLRLAVRTLIAAALLLPLGTFAQAQTTERPIQDWIAANQAAADILWFDAGAPVPAPRVYFDMFGRQDAAFGLHLGTRFDGSIREFRLADGRARVQVIERASRVLTYATQDGPGMIFGHSGPDVANGADAGLATMQLTIEFTNIAPGAPLPSFNALSFQLDNPNFHMERMGLVAHAEGTLRQAYGMPDGTPGVVITSQQEIVRAPGRHIDGKDLFPAEKIQIRPGH